MKRKTRHNGCAGSVLMETIIAMPLYMILLGGIFWLGDLMVTRQQLVIADRYIAWNKGMHHADKGRFDNAAIHGLFFTEANGTVSQYHKPVACDGQIEKMYQWFHMVNGQAKFEQRMPEWTRYMFNTAQIMYNTSTPLEKATMQGRDKPDQRHVVLMRNERGIQPKFIRNRYGVDGAEEISKNWRQMADQWE